MGERRGGSRNLWRGPVVTMEEYLDTRVVEVPVVGSPKKAAPPSSLERKEYHTDGEWSFKSVPSVVHFDGFQVGKVHTQILRLVNTADYGQRLHVIKTQNATFSTHVVRGKRKGREDMSLVAPGLSEDVRIEFHPTEWRYYYDCIRVHTEDGNMLIPIHAYPTTNEVVFPRRVDFGRCDLSERKERRFKLECKVPLDFEYTIERADGVGAAEFEVSPMRGVISKSKPAEIAISFQPVKAATSTLELKVTVATYEPKPLLCEITGSGFSRLQKE